MVLGLSTGAAPIWRWPDIFAVPHPQSVAHSAVQTSVKELRVIRLPLGWGWLTWTFVVGTDGTC
jgi:hypothetical protein